MRIDSFAPIYIFIMNLHECIIPLWPIFEGVYSISLAQVLTTSGCSVRFRLMMLVAVSARIYSSLLFFCKLRHQAQSVRANQPQLLPLLPSLPDDHLRDKNPTILFLGFAANSASRSWSGFSGRYCSSLSNSSAKGVSKRSIRTKRHDIPTT